MIDRAKVKELMHKLKDYSKETYDHSIETANIAVIIAQRFGYSEDELEMLFYASVLHDIGKTKIDKEILHSPNKLTNEEFAEMKKHIQYSYEMLEDFPEQMREIALHHHEKLNGNGYLGLKEDELSEFDKILTVADITSALHIKRSYKEAYTPEEIASKLQENVDKGELVQKYVDVALEEYVFKNNEELTY